MRGKARMFAICRPSEKKGGGGGTNQVVRFADDVIPPDLHYVTRGRRRCILPLPTQEVQPEPSRIQSVLVGVGSADD